MYLIDVARVTRSVKRNGYCSVKKVYAQTWHREYSLGQNERIHRAKIPQRKMKTNARIPPIKKRGKKQINHFWAVKPANKIWNDKESYEVKRSERLTFHFSIFFPSWFFSTVSQYVARNPPESRKKFKIEHFYDNHRIDFFHFFPGHFASIVYFCCQYTHHVLQNIVFVFNRNDKLFVNFRLRNASHCLEYLFTGKYRYNQCKKPWSRAR